MSIVVAFWCGVGGWFVGVVSAYLLYRVLERATPPNVDTRTVVGCELKPEPSKLELVR